VAGKLRFRRFSDEDWTECSCETTDWSIPISSLWSRAVHASSTSNSDDLVLVESDAVYLLLVEKEGIFHRLVEDQLYE
jgi:DNA topoisomerase VI subunit A